MHDWWYKIPFIYLYNRVIKWVSNLLLNLYNYDNNNYSRNFSRRFSIMAKNIKIKSGRRNVAGSKTQDRLKATSSDNMVDREGLHIPGELIGLYDPLAIWGQCCHVLQHSHRFSCAGRYFLFQWMIQTNQVHFITWCSNIFSRLLQIEMKYCIWISSSKHNCFNTSRIGLCENIKRLHASRYDFVNLRILTYLFSMGKVCPLQRQCCLVRACHKQVFHC